MSLDDALRPILSDGLRKTMDWYRLDGSYFLRSIFDQVGFIDRDVEQNVYFSVPASLSSTLKYPVKGDTDVLKKAKTEVLLEINEKYKGFSDVYLNELSVNQLLFLLEKFGGSVPFDGSQKVSIYDAYKVKAAKAVIQSGTVGQEAMLFINVDLSGIQKFIYNISSTGALKSLRSRSFFIELLGNHIARKVLNAFKLHNVNLLMSGGGTIHILSSCPEDYKERLSSINYCLNKWLHQEFNGRLYAAFSYVKCSDECLERDLTTRLDKLSMMAFGEKQQKFKTLIDKGEISFLEDEDPKYQGCETCFRDDTKILEDKGRYSCHHCKRLIELGSQIPKARFIYECNKDTRECLQIEDSYYFLSPEEKSGMTCLWAVYEDGDNFVNCLKDSATHVFVRTYIKRNKDLPPAVYKKVVEKRDELKTALSREQDEAKRIFLDMEIDLLGDESTATFEYMAECSDGAKLIGALRMDADNIGKLMHYGFGSELTLEGLSAFSRNLNYFFKLHLESFCRNGRQAEGSSERRNVHVIYAGGDDLFVVGAWSDVVSLTMDIGTAFRRYTCDNIDIGVSGGMTLHQPKFPVNKMADESLSALSVAKNDKQPCWMCRKDWVNCPFYDIGKCSRKYSLCLFFTEPMAYRKRKIDEKHSTPRYSQEPSRLKLALKWKSYDSSSGKIVDEVDEFIMKPFIALREGENKIKIGRGFYHNVLSLLDSWYDEGMLYMPKVVWIMEKFKNELKRHRLESEEGETLYDLYETYLHLYDTKRFSTLHLPLLWIINLMKGENKDETQTYGRKTNG